MKLNRTTLRTVQILKMASKHPDGVTLDDICGQLEMPKTSAYDIVTTLVQTGMLQVERGAKQHYRIGLTAYRVGVNYTNNLDFVSAIDPLLRAFSRELGKTVFFGVRSEAEIVYLCKFEPDNPIITTATVGTKNPLYCTSLGKAILAFEEEEVQDELFGRIHFRRQTSRTIADLPSLKEELSRVKCQGYALDARELEEHMECVGAPVFGQDGKVLGAISASSLYKPEEDYQALGKRISQKAAELSRVLGFIGNPFH